MSRQAAGFHPGMNSPISDLPMPDLVGRLAVSSAALEPGVLSGARTIHHCRARGPYRRFMPRSTPAIERVSTAVRLPAALHAELRRQAHERDVSVNFLVTRAVDHYLRELGPADPLALHSRDDHQRVLT